MGDPLKMLIWHLIIWGYLCYESVATELLYQMICPDQSDLDCARVWQNLKICWDQLLGVLCFLRMFGWCFFFCLSLVFLGWEFLFCIPLGKLRVPCFTGRLCVAEISTLENLNGWEFVISGCILVNWWWFFRMMMNNDNDDFWVMVVNSWLLLLLLSLLSEATMRLSSTSSMWGIWLCTTVEIGALWSLRWGVFSPVFWGVWMFLFVLLMGFFFSSYLFVMAVPGRAIGHLKRWSLACDLWASDYAPGSAAVVNL